MRKQWNIETIDLTPPTPVAPEEDIPTTKIGRFKRAVKKNWLKALLIVLCVYTAFFICGMCLTEYYIDENGVRQPISVSFGFLERRDDYKALSEQYSGITDLLVDISVIDIHLANGEYTAMEAATYYSSILDGRVDVMIPKITALELDSDQAVIQQTMETLLSNDLAVYLQKIVEGLKTGDTDTVNTALVWREKAFSTFETLRGDMGLLADAVKADSKWIRDWELEEAVLEKDPTAYLNE